MSAEHNGVPRTNQYKPIPPKPELEKWVRYYWHLGLSDKDIASHVLDHFPQGQYGLSAKSTKRCRERINLFSARKAHYSEEDFLNIFKEIRYLFPTMGARQMVYQFRQDYSIKITEKYLLNFMRDYEPDAVKARAAKRFKRRVYYGTGVMEVLSMDQHDKWKRFGLYLHCGLDPFTGRIHWLKIWWTNRNPVLIGGYYFEAARSQKGVPLKSQGDPGVENNVVANAHTEVRQRLDPRLHGTLQHKVCHRKQNIKPEITWSVIRHGFTPGFEEYLDAGVASGLYDYSDPIQRLVFRWLAIPWLQAELDKWKDGFNTRRRRHSKHKLLPQEIPDLLHFKPGRYGFKDFTVPVPDSLFDEVEAKWCPRSDPVFQLVPPLFEQQISQYYSEMGSPNISIHTFWTIYSKLVACFDPQNAAPIIDSLQHQEDVAFEKVVELLPGQRPCRDWDPLVGTNEDDEETEVAQILAPRHDEEEIIAAFGDAEQYRGYVDLTDEE